METISIVGPESAVTAVPQILGFAPRRSVVLLWIAHGSVAVAQRADLPSTHATQWGSALVQVASRVGADSVLDIWVDERLPDPAAVTSIHAACDERGIGRVATLATDGGAWLAEGIPWGRRRDLPKALRWDAPRREDFTVAPAVSGRLIRRVRPLDEAETDAVISALFDRSGPEIATVASSDARRVVRALQLVEVRDRILWHVCANPAVARPVALRLTDLLRSVGPRATGQIAITAAMAFWVAGDGYRASVVLERARADAPDEALGHILTAALRAGLPPATWVSMVQGTPCGYCERGRVCA